MTKFEDWTPPEPPGSPDDDIINVVDPRVITAHSVGQLPVPPNPPPPVGWIYWKGSIPSAGVKLAVTMLHDPITYPMGSFVQKYIVTKPGTYCYVIAARVEWHNIQGATGKTGCFRGVNLMRSVPVEADDSDHVMFS